MVFKTVAEVGRAAKDNAKRYVFSEWGVRLATLYNVLVCVEGTGMFCTVLVL